MDSITFKATEFGFERGLGGASNSESQDGYHYVLFGLEADDQHLENCGAYFEYDDQMYGSVNIVTEIHVFDRSVKFMLRNGLVITIECSSPISKWDEFLNGIRSIFETNIINYYNAD